VVIRNEGPIGGPGMRELVTVTALLQGMKKDVALVTDGRFSGASYGFCVGYVTPEAAKGGLIGLVEEGDTITIDINSKTMTLEVGDEVLEQRRKVERGDPSGKAHLVAAGYPQKYIASVGPANRGAVTHSGNVNWVNEADKG
jgi:dihydroxy-acid dehydratase